MNSQPAHTYPDARIDQVLSALRTTEPPTGLEERVAQRIAARLAQAAEARQVNPTNASATILSFTSSPASFFSVILNAVKDPCSSFVGAKLYTAATALTLLVALTTLTLHHRTPSTTARITPTVRIPASVHGLEGAGLQSRHNAPTRTAALAVEAISNPLPPSAQDLPPSAQDLPPSAQDPDAIALAETLAPSRPAPAMPLTPQEHLMLAAMRPGQPIQLAELDIARAPILRAAAEARETASIDRYAKSLLVPFAVADELQPTTFSQPQESPTPTPPPPSNSSPN